MSTAVIVGEIKAIDWARRAGNPRTPLRRPAAGCAAVTEPEGAGLGIADVASGMRRLS